MQAIRYSDGLLAGFAELAETPLLAPACDHIRAAYRRKQFNRHVGYFRPTDYGIRIVRMLHVQMDAARHL